MTVVASMAAVYVAGTLLSCPDRASGRDPPARRSECLPARAGGQARVRHRPAADLVRAAGSGAPRAGPPRRRRARPRLAGSDRRDRRLDPAPADRPWRGPQRARRPSLVRPRPLDHHLPVDRRGACPDVERGGARPRRARCLAVADRPADRRAGAAAGALDRADRGRPDDAAGMAARRRPAHPDRVDLGDQRQEHRDPADDAHPGPRRAARSGRPPRTGCWSTSG